LLWQKTLVLAVALISPTALEAQCRAASASHSVALIELYTSEGCDSCPPADRWLSRLKLDGGGERAVALAFHVDYWDRLGWKDRFASAAFTQRQYEQARRRHSDLVFTPQVLLQGRDFDAWRSGAPSAAIAAINARPARAFIELDAQNAAAGAVTVDVHVHVPQASDRAHATVAVALTQSGLISDVKAGENAGKRLAHDNVVRAWEAGVPLGPGGELQRSIRWPLPQERGQVSIVALVEDVGTGEVLQALALPLCAP
jgi:hypothetical protein